MLAKGLLKHRNVKLDEISKRAGDEYQRRLDEIQAFGRRVGRMASADDGEIDTAIEDVLHCLKGRTGAVNSETTAPELLAKFIGKGRNGGLTISGRFYVEIKTRLRRWSLDPGRLPVGPAASAPRKGEDDLPFYGEKFPPSSCSLKAASGGALGRPKVLSPRQPDLGLCVRGCDLWELLALGFQQEEIAKILGLDRSILESRLIACEDALRDFRVKKKEEKNPQSRPR